MLYQDGPRLGDGGELDGARLLCAEAAIGTEQYLDGDGHVVLPQQKHVLPEVLVLLALKHKCQRCLVSRGYRMSNEPRCVFNLDLEGDC